MQSIRLAPPNSVILVMDPNARDLPKSMGSSLASATPSALAIGCQAEMDGETEIRLGHDQEVDQGTPRCLSGDWTLPQVLYRFERCSTRKCSPSRWVVKA